jgi:hypothetical protein
MVIGPSGPGTKNDCASTDQQQFTRPTKEQAPEEKVFDKITLLTVSISSVGPEPIQIQKQEENQHTKRGFLMWQH